MQHYYMTYLVVRLRASAPLRETKKNRIETNQPGSNIYFFDS